MSEPRCEYEAYGLRCHLVPEHWGDHELWIPRQSPPGGTPNRPPDLKAAEAAQSPQVGAALAGESEGLGRPPPPPLRSLLEAWMDLDPNGTNTAWREKHGRALGEDFEWMYVHRSFGCPRERLRELTLAALAPAGRSVSGRPPESAESSVPLAARDAEWREALVLAGIHMHPSGARGIEHAKDTAPLRALLSEAARNTSGRPPNPLNPKGKPGP